MHLWYKCYYFVFTVILMIQRVQSLFLTASVLISLLLFFIPVYRFINDAVMSPETPNREYFLPENGLLAILNGGIGVLTLICIFLYRNRNMQIRLGNLCLLLTAILTGLLFFVADTLSGGLNQRVQFIAGSYLPIIQMVCLFVAIRFIKRDEELVRSADRLR